MIRLLLVDDHPIVRQGLTAALQDQPDLEVVGAAGCAEDAIRLAAELRPEVTLLDLELPGEGGVAALPALLRAAPGSRIVVFTAYGTEERVRDALAAGAGGYLLKGASVAEIAAAIRVVHAGGRALSPAVRQAACGGGAVLSRREREVLRLVAAGQSNKQVARSLGITERTAKYHLSSIFAKLGVDNRARAVALGMERGLL